MIDQLVRKGSAGGREMARHLRITAKSSDRPAWRGEDDLGVVKMSESFAGASSRQADTAARCCAGVLTIDLVGSEMRGPFRLLRDAGGAAGF